jgi:mannobiose 2-epimerase
MNKTQFVLIAFISLVFWQCSGSSEQTMQADKKLSETIDTHAQALLNNWYPLVINSIDGGYYSEVTSDFKLGARHDKMVVSQARHIWTNATAAMHYNNPDYLRYARHGYLFLKETMWDSINGGFHTIVDKGGTPIFTEGTEKSAYGNTFAIYALATYYSASKEEEALALAKTTFAWLEKHSHDSQHKGYFQTLDMRGTPYIRSDSIPSTSDIGYKDQNSTIHLLEAFTALYKVWPDPLLAQRLEELLKLLQSNIITKKGYMNLFFTNDWKAISFAHEDKATIMQHYYLDHISFGHDVETAYLMMEASKALGITNDSSTLLLGKKMVDHALTTGWDKKNGGFYDGGYYHKNTDSISILNKQKNWWSQAEGLNTLLIMHQHFPNDTMDYKKHFDALWDYCLRYQIDPANKGWYEWGIDYSPASADASKGHIWKTTYHNFRALVNIKEQLQDDKRSFE